MLIHISFGGFIWVLKQVITFQIILNLLMELILFLSEMFLAIILGNMVLRYLLVMMCSLRMLITDWIQFWKIPLLEYQISLQKLWELVWFFIYCNEINTINWHIIPKEKPIRSSIGVCAFKYILELANIPDNKIKSIMIGSIDKLLILVIIKKKPIILPIETRCKLDFNFRLKSTYIQVKLSEVPKKRIPKFLIVGILSLIHIWRCRRAI